MTAAKVTRRGGGADPAVVIGRARRRRRGLSRRGLWDKVVKFVGYEPHAESAASVATRKKNAAKDESESGLELVF